MLDDDGVFISESRYQRGCDGRGARRGDRARMIPARVRELDRRWSWVAALAVGVWVASVVHPVSWTQVLSNAQNLPYHYAGVYSELHARPFAYCDSYTEQRQAALSEVPREDAAGLWSNVGAYNTRIQRHYAEDCRQTWRPYEDPARFQAYFAQSYVLYFAVGVLGLSEVHLALGAVLVNWLGLLAFALLCTWAWRSVLASIAGFAVVAALLEGSFAKMIGLSLPGISGALVVPGRALYSLVSVLLIVAMVAWVPRESRALRHPAFWSLPAVFALHGLLYLLVDPPVARFFTWIALGFVGIVAVARRTWPLLACALLAVALQSGLWAWYAGPSREIYGAVTNYDHLSSEAYASFMMYMGLLERPSPLGLFYMDEVFRWGHLQDPVAGTLAPHLTVHHSYADTGRALIRDAVLTHPLAVVEAVARRLLVQVFYRPLWYVWEIHVDWVYTLTVVGMLAINVAAILFSRWWMALTLLSLSICVNQFALDTVMTLVHVHSRWNQLGVLLMFGAAPIYVFAAVGMIVNRRQATWPGWAESLRRPIVAGPVIAVLLGLAATGGPAAAALLEDERDNLEIWMRMHRPPPEGVDIDSVLRNLDERRRVTGDPDGSLAMWAAAIAYMYESRSPASATKDETQLRREVTEEEVNFAAGRTEREEGCWRLEGKAEGPYSYLLTTRSQSNTAGASLFVEGELSGGGLTVGLQVGGQWVQTHSITEAGRFSVALEPPAEGEVGIVIANNQPDPATPTIACVASISWREPTAAALMARQGDSLRERKEAYFRAALAADPRNPHFPYYARFLQIPGWEQYLLEATRRFPDAPYAAGALAALWYSTPPAATDATPADRLYRVDLARRYESAVARFLQSTGDGNPLYVATPSVVESRGIPIETTLVSDQDGRRLLRLRLPPQSEVWLSPHQTWGSHLTQLFAYVHMIEGDADAALSFDGAGRRRLAARLAISPETQSTEGRYVRFYESTRPDEKQFALWIRAGEDGAVVEVADHYPMLHTPSGYYRSLLASGALDHHGSPPAAAVR